MKYMKVAFLCLLVFGGSNLLFSSDAMEYNKAIQYLEERGEVCFNFYINSPSELKKLTEIISIDNVTGNEVFAYANKAEFNEFLKQNYYYEVKTPPGLVGEVEMSDYSDYLEKGIPPEWDKYPTYGAYEDIMDKFATDYPDLCRIEHFGNSVNNRKLLAAVISDNVGEEEKEVKFFYQSTIHGDETAPWIFMLNLIEYLLENYGSDARVTNLVDNIEIWINPLCNPDGTYRSGDNTISGAQRNNANNRDLNRDFPYVNLYGKECRPLAQPETQATLDLCDEHVFTMSGDFHGGTELVCYIWGMSSKNHADQDWWEYVGNEYADLAQESANNSGYFTAQGDGCTNAFDWYEVQGERMNHAAHQQQCRSLTVEVSYTKKLSESNLTTYWNYNKESIITYLEQVLYGIHGTVTDSITGDPLPEVEVFVDNHDVDNSEVYTSTFGAYYRPILAGTYDITFSLQGYQSKTIENVSATNKQTTILDVRLWDGSTHVNVPYIVPKPFITIVPFSQGIRINCKGAGKVVKAGVYNLDGSLVQQLPVQETMVWDGKNNRGCSISNGCYIIRIETSKQALTKNFVFSR